MKTKANWFRVLEQCVSHWKKREANNSYPFWGNVVVVVVCVFKRVEIWLCQLKIIKSIRSGTASNGGKENIYSFTVNKSHHFQLRCEVLIVSSLWCDAILHKSEFFETINEQWWMVFRRVLCEAGQFNAKLIKASIQMTHWTKLKLKQQQIVGQHKESERERDCETKMNKSKWMNVIMRWQSLNG